MSLTSKTIWNSTGGHREQQHRRRRIRPRPKSHVEFLLPLICCWQFTLVSAAFCIVPSAMAVPGIPSSWEKCADQQSCRNGGICYSDGISEFCVCGEGYGGKKCERLIESMVYLFDTPLSAEQLALLCKFAFFIGVVAALVALFGWTCCCMKHLNARRLYLHNIELARENRLLHETNQRQSKRTIHLYAALAKAKGLIEAEPEVGPNGVDVTPEDRAFGGTLRSMRISSDSRHSVTPATPQSPNHRVLMRELSEMHDELRRSIEGAEKIIEILHKAEEAEVPSRNEKRPSSKWWSRLRQLVRERMDLLRANGEDVLTDDTLERQPLKPPQRNHLNEHKE